MLDALRQNSKNTIIYVLFGVLIAMFVASFGPGSKGGCEGTSSGGGGYAAKVAGVSVSELEYRYAYIAQGFHQYPPQFARENHLKERVMDKLIDRELLAQEAERLGFQVSTKQVEAMVEDGRMYVLGSRVKVDEFFKDGVYDYDRFKSFCQNRLGVTVTRFIEVQQRELMADQVRQLILGTAKVPEGEVRADYNQRNTTVNLEFVQFPARRYEDASEPTAEEIAAFRKTHEEPIKKQYEERPYLYKKIDKHAHLRRILVAAPKAASEAEVARAQAKADDAAKRIRGGEAFAQVARQVSEDALTKGRGGDSGWRKKGFTGLGPALDDKVFQANSGDLVGPERSDRGFELVRVEGFREGDLSLDQVADEIAEEQLRNEKARDRARIDAEAAAAKLRAGGKLAELYPKPTGATDEDPIRLLNGAPQAKETGPFPRKGEVVPEVGISAGLMKLAFESKAGAALGPVDVGSGWVVATVKERKDPDQDFFEKHKGEEIRRAEREKWAEVLTAWTQKRCQEARDDGRIRVSEEVLAYEGLPKGELKYEPCTTRQ